jgi:hypothetical protein
MSGPIAEPDVAVHQGIAQLSPDVEARQRAKFQGIGIETRAGGFAATRFGHGRTRAFKQSLLRARVLPQDGEANKDLELKRGVAEIEPRAQALAYQADAPPDAIAIRMIEDHRQFIVAYLPGIPIRVFLFQCTDQSTAGVWRR